MSRLGVSMIMRVIVCGGVIVSGGALVVMLMCWAVFAGMVMTVVMVMFAVVLMGVLVLVPVLMLMVVSMLALVLMTTMVRMGVLVLMLVVMHGFMKLVVDHLERYRIDDRKNAGGHCSVKRSRFNGGCGNAIAKQRHGLIECCGSSRM
jgi:hypothetical protein